MSCNAYSQRPLCTGISRDVRRTILLGAPARFWRVASTLVTPYQSIADELRRAGIHVRAPSLRALFNALLDLKGLPRRRLTKKSVRKALLHYAATGAIDAQTPPTGVRCMDQDYQPLRWPTCKQQSDYMQGRREQNLQASAVNPNEAWLDLMLQPFRQANRWERQYRWGYRIFDFFCMKLGIAIEVDGPEHDERYDAFRDTHNFLRSGIVVLRVRNKNQADAEAALRFVQHSNTRRERRLEIAPSAPERKSLVTLWRAGAFDGERLLNDTRSLGYVPRNIEDYHRPSRRALAAPGHGR